MKKTLWAGLWTCFFMASAPLDAQWARTYSNSGLAYYPIAISNSIRPTYDGGFIVAGSYYTNEHIYEASVMKLSPEGTIEWQSSWGDQYQDRAFFAAQTKDGGYIVGGTGTGCVDIFVTKLGAGGEIQWRYYYPAPWKAEGAAYEGRSPGDIRQTWDGGYIVIGFVPDQKDPGDRDIWILKLFATGEIEWQKTYGGKGEDQGFSIIQTAEGGFIAACEISDDFGNYNFGFLKLTGNGDLISAQAFRGSGPAGVVDWGTTIEETPDGGFITACSYRSQNASDMLILKLLSDGNMGPNCKLADNKSLSVTETFIIPRKGSLLRQDPGLFINPSSIDLQTAPLRMTLLCGPGQSLNQKKKGVIRR